MGPNDSLTLRQFLDRVRGLDQQVSSLEDKRVRDHEYDRVSSLEDKRARGLDYDRVSSLEDQQTRSFDDLQVQFLEDQQKCITREDRHCRLGNKI